MAIDVSKYDRRTPQEKPEQKSKDRSSWMTTDIELFGSRLNDQKRLKVFSDLSILISSGVDLNSVINLLREEASSSGERKAFNAIGDGIDKGKSLSEAMTLSGLFSEYECHTIRIGEQTGKLSNVLKELADFYEDKVRLKRMVVRALTYPVIVLFIAFGIFYFMLDVVIPTFADFFAQHDRELPGFTQKVIALSDNFDTYALILLVGLLALVGLHRILKASPLYRNTVSKIVLGIPFVGTLVKEVHLSRFCHSMGFLTQSEVGLIDSLDLVKNTMTFYPIQSVIEEVKQDVIKGSSLNESLAKHKIFGKRLVSLIKFGERSNQMGPLFSELGKQYTVNAEHRTKIISNIVEPLLIVLIAAIVGVIMVAIYMPMADMGTIVE